MQQNISQRDTLHCIGKVQKDVQRVKLQKITEYRKVQTDFIQIFVKLKFEGVYKKMQNLDDLSTFRNEIF